MMIMSKTSNTRSPLFTEQDGIGAMEHTGLRQQQGSIMGLVLVCIFLFGTLVTVSITLMMQHQRSVHMDLSRDQATLLAESGIECAVSRLRDGAPKSTLRHEIPGVGTLEAITTKTRTGIYRIVSTGHCGRRGLSPAIDRSVTASVSFDNGRITLLSWNTGAAPATLSSSFADSQPSAAPLVVSENNGSNRNKIQADFKKQWMAGWILLIGGALFLVILFAAIFAGLRKMFPLSR